MKLTVNAPWTKGDLVVEGHLAFISHAIDQLKFFQSQGNATQSLKDDIAGYQMIVESKSEENATQFMRLKSEARIKGLKIYKSNLNVVESLKSQGLWVNT